MNNSSRPSFTQYPVTVTVTVAVTVFALHFPSFDIATVKNPWHSRSDCFRSVLVTHFDPEPKEADSGLQGSRSRSRSRGIYFSNVFSRSVNRLLRYSTSRRGTVTCTRHLFQHWSAEYLDIQRRRIIIQYQPSFADGVEGLGVRATRSVITVTVTVTVTVTGYLF